ncbi:unnamed protein product [Ectocarpus sp. 12 AP-2014]
MISEGSSEHLDAFIVALNQTCDGGEKRWYASTLELQLASLEFVGRADACRPCTCVSIHEHLVACGLLATNTPQQSTSAVARLVSGVVSRLCRLLV